MPGNKRGFTFIELILAIAIIAIIAAIAIPNLRTRLPGYQRGQFISHLNALTQVAWQNAVATHNFQRVVFDVSKRTITVEEKVEKKTEVDSGFKPIISKYLDATFEWPESNFEIKNFFIGKRDEITLTLGQRKGRIWFYISPDGFAQPVIINIIDLKERVIGKEGREFSLVLNPFTVQFKEYDTFKRPD